MHIKFVGYKRNSNMFYVTHKLTMYMDSKHLTRNQYNNLAI